MMDPSAAELAWPFQLSPIQLVNGIASQMPGGMLPIVALTDPEKYASGFPAGAGIDPDSFFANWWPLPGTEATSWELGRYPFANQATAANAVIQMPLKVGLLMQCPAKAETVPYLQKLTVFSSAIQTVTQHILAGGSFSIATPSQIYPTALLLRVYDASTEDSRQAQFIWRWDFEVPLITLAQASASYNNLLSRLDSGSFTAPGSGGSVPWSGTGTAAGAPSSSPISPYPTSQGSPPAAIPFSSGFPQ